MIPTGPLRPPLRSAPPAPPPRPLLVVARGRGRRYTPGVFTPVQWRMLEEMSKDRPMREIAPELGMTLMSIHVRVKEAKKRCGARTIWGLMLVYERLRERKEKEDGKWRE